MSQQLADLFNSNCRVAEGFPYPEWAAFYKFASENLTQPELDPFWCEIASIWVDRIRERLGPEYRRFDSEDVILVTSEPDDVARRMLHFCEEKTIRLRKILKGIAIEEYYGKQVVLHFGFSDIYWQYVSEFHGDGEVAASAGSFLFAGYSHIALASEYYWATETILLHEMTHGCLMHLPIPLWLNEAIARSVEIECGLTQSLIVDREIFDKHHENWDEASIQAFWHGEAFRDAEVFSELSYMLAEILMNLIVDEVRGEPERFKRFVNEANREDCGEGAAQAHLGKSLGEIVSRFLGPGDWTPLPMKPEDESDDDEAPATEENA